MPYETPDAHAILTTVAEAGVRLVDLQFSDIAGGAKSLTIPVELLPTVLESGYRFDGAALTGGLRTIELDLFLVPDPATLRVVPSGGALDGPRTNESGPSAAGLPRARFSCAVRRRDGGPFAGDPRSVLERAIAAAAEMGFRYRVAIEMEYYLLPADPASGRGALTRAGDRPVDVAGYFGVGEDIVSATRDAVMLALQGIGISVGGAHHETGPGQEEIDLNDTDALTMADQLITVRQVIRSVAQRAGLRATFMPKPMADAPGSGVHIFQGLQRVEDDGDAFTWDASDLSGEAYWFIGGQLRHAAGMSLITNPTVNSYKRLNAGHRAPRHATWARVSQASLIRVPSHLAQQAAELELRSPDALANPYLALAIALTCGLDGIRHRVDPPEPLDESFVSYDEEDLDRRGILRLPTHLGEAIAALEEDDLVRAALGDYLTDQLLTVKRAEWQDYRAHVSPWELARYADA